MGRKKIAVDEKEEMFCRYFVESASPREAAAKAGYSFPERNALKLLQTDRIREEILRLFKKESENSIRSLVISGYKRLAFGSVADAALLAFNDGELSAGELEKLDLFCISEIKKPKTGGVEIKFFNRLDALEKLYELSCSEETSGSIPFFEALSKGAAALSLSPKNDESEMQVL